MESGVPVAWFRGVVVWRGSEDRYLVAQGLQPPGQAFHHIRRRDPVRGIDERHEKDFSQR
jgi:hypothetical protein